MNNRMKEPSTWAGLAGVLVAFGLNIPAELVQPLSVVLGAVSSLAIFLRERGNG